MATTGKHLKIKRMGDVVLGVKLQGDKRKPEPETFRTRFPGGWADVTRTTDGEYWVHVFVNRKESLSYDPCHETARITNARLDIHGKDSVDADTGDFDHDGLYHVAVRVGSVENAEH